MITGYENKKCATCTVVVNLTGFVDIYFLNFPQNPGYYGDVIVLSVFTNVLFTLVRKAVTKTVVPP
jgi:hypothetical protein